MLTVACVLSEGPKRNYDKTHVERLRGMVAQHIKQPYKFVCVNDSPFPGWWAKVSLCEPGRFSGRVLYLDLDTTVIGNLDDLADYPYPFAAISDYQFPLTINSSVMSWNAGFLDHVYKNFTLDVMNRLHGDQNWLHEQANAFHFPKQWCPSYREHVLKGGMHPDARVVVHHGFPKPWDDEVAKYVKDFRRASGPYFDKVLARSLD